MTRHRLSGIHSAETAATTGCTAARSEVNSATRTGAPRPTDRGPTLRRLYANSCHTNLDSDRDSDPDPDRDPYPDRGLSVHPVALTGTDAISATAATHSLQQTPQQTLQQTPKQTSATETTAV